MELLVIIYSIATFVLICAFGSKFGKSWDNKDRKIEFIKGNKSEDDISHKLDESFVNRFITSKIKVLSDLADKKDGKIKKNSKTKQIENQLRLAGKNITVANFLFYKQAFMVLIIAISVFAMILTGNFLVLMIGLIISLLGPNMYLSSSAKGNQQAIREQIPDALDLLCVCVESGLSFDAALLKVSEKMEGPFINELNKIYQQIQMGVQRTEALHSLADGTEIPELKTFVAALAQASQLGIPINNVMRVQSDQLRQTRMQLAKEKGMKAPVKMLLPMIGLIFPVLFIILMGPAVLNIMEMF